MRNLIFSIRNNVLRVNVAGIDEFVGFSRELPKGLDVVKLAAEINSLLHEQFGPKIKDFIIHYCMESEDVVLKFLTISKSVENMDDELLKEIEGKLKEEDLSVEEVYYSYQKIAPFVHQLIAVKKEKLDDVVELSNVLGFELKTVSPWTLMVPRLVSKSGEPCIFLVNNTLVLSELKGVYYVDIVDSGKSIDEIKGLLSDLLVYKRSEPIERIYVRGAGFDLKSDKFEIIELVILDKYLDSQGFISHAIIEEILLNEPEVFTTQVNLLNVLPLPVMEKSNSTLAYVGAALGIVLIVGVVFGAYYISKNKGMEVQESDQIATTEQPVVLSGDVGVKETTETRGEDAGENGNPPLHEEGELAKEDLVIRVENGTQIFGYATNTKTFLEGLGYTVDSVGDAEVNNEGKTILVFKTSRLEYSDLLIKDLENDYSLGEVEQGLDDSFEYDVLLVIGNE